MIALLLATAAVLPSGPLEFRARDMRIDPQDRRVVLDGDVQLVRGDLNVKGRHAVADYAKEQPAAKARPRGKASQAEATVGGQTVEKFTVQGNVHVERGSRTADGEQGIVDVPGQTLVLTGTPKPRP
jgi:lipopolysaccharide export system protein LptA